jgi:hypothetical protein
VDGRRRGGKLLEVISIGTGIGIAASPPPAQLLVYQQFQTPSRAEPSPEGVFIFGRKVQPHLRGKLKVGLFSLTVLIAGCSTTGWMHTSRLAPTTLTTEDAITVIAYETESISQISETADVPAEYSADMAEEVLECIEEILEEHYPTVRVIPPDKFLEVAFPDLTAEDSLPVILSWEHMARDPGFQERIAPLGLRYLITVFVEEGKGNTVFAGPDPGTYPPPPIFIAGWDTWASMHANVVDLLHARDAGEVRAGATGRSTAGIICIVPFYIPSFPEWRACDELAAGVVQLLAGESPLEEIGIRPAMAEDEVVPIEEETVLIEEWAIPNHAVGQPSALP